MPILALDTTTLVSSVALAVEDRLLAELTLQTQKKHSERLLPHIAALLNMAGIERQDLKAVAVSIGPGSFTGLRIGLGTAKALAYALKIPLLGVSTLLALAYSCPVPGAYFAPMLDAQKGNIYLALYQWQAGELQELWPASVVVLQEALEKLAALTQPAVVLGEAAVMYSEEIAAHYGQLVLPPPHLIIPKAGSVAVLGRKMLAAGQVSDVFTLEPLYIRRSEAEELWEQRKCQEARQK